MNQRLRIITLTVAVLALVGALLPATTASAFTYRASQVVFNYVPLQNYLNIVDTGINVATQQVDAQVWSVGVTGNTDFTLTLRNGPGNFSVIGVYNGDNPLVLFPVFPAAAQPGWYAALHFGGGSLWVSLFDQFNVFQGQTVYGGVTQNKFGFYIQGPAGLFFSQDWRNAPPTGAPQVLTYASNDLPGEYWECFEALPYNPATSTFDGVVLNLQSVKPTPARATTWGRIKAQYK